MKMAFSELFDEHGEAVTPKVPVYLNGTTIRPGLSLSGEGILVGDVPLLSLRGKELDVEDRNGVMVVKGVL
jgi:hypothetical protein